MESLNPTQPSVSPVDPMDKFSPTKVTADTVQPSGVPPTNPYDQVENIKVKGKSKGPLIILLSVLTVLVIFIGAGAFFALVAYGKIDLNNKEFERKISFAVQALPFTPKTAEYLIYKSIDAQQDLKSVYVDASIALTGSEAMTPIPGLGNSFDLKITGPVDFHDEKNPEAEINLKMTPELDADFVAVNDKLFFKINDVPAVLEGLASGAGYSLDIFLAKWIVYDLKSLESDARAALDEDKSVRDEEQYIRLKTALLNSDAIHKIVVSETTLDDKSVYELTLEMTSEEYLAFVNEVARAMDPEDYGNQLAKGTTSTQTFENLKITTYIDKSTMHTVRSMLSFRLQTSDFKVPSQVLGASTIQYFPNIYAQAVKPEDEYMDVSIVVNGSRFNEDFEVKEPENATPIETIIEQYTQQMMMQYKQSGSSLDSDSEGFSTPDDEISEEEDDSGISPY